MLARLFQRMTPVSHDVDVDHSDFVEAITYIASAVHCLQLDSPKHVVRHVEALVAEYRVLKDNARILREQRDAMSAGLAAIDAALAGVEGGTILEKVRRLVGERSATAETGRP